MDPIYSLIETICKWFSIYLLAKSMFQLENEIMYVILSLIFWSISYFMMQHRAITTAHKITKFMSKRKNND